MRKTLRQAMMDGVHFLQSHQIEDAISDGRILFEAAFSIDRTHYLLNGDQEAESRQGKGIPAVFTAAGSR